MADKRLVISRRLEDPKGLLDDAEVTMQDAIEPFDESSADMSVILDLIAKDYQPKFGPSSLSSSPAQFIQTFSDLSFTLRSEEESYMREPIAGERPCARGIDCEGRKLYNPTGPVTLVEHLTAQQRQDPPEKPQMCVICKRYIVTFCVLNSMAEGTDMTNLFHSHCNYVNTLGEYALDQCLLAGRTETHGVLAPCVAHCRYYYSPFHDPKGFIRFVQTGYKEIVRGPDGSTRDFQ